ncbi:MAG: tetratricopeptide repeat protein [Chloracidobacterium sp.]|nr:tetratricopeptide repeat protein [Chloracidobacterium sp.]
MKQLRIILFSLLLCSAAFCQQSDSALRGVIGKDRSDKSKDGELPTLSAAEHLQRGQTYFDNRQFPQAREHFQKIFDNYPTDPSMSGALFMTGRSYYWEREYAKAIPFLDRAAREYPGTKDGREGLNFKGACNVRLGNNEEAAKIYEQYTIMYPTGERIDGAHLNIIDALREAGKYDEANLWVDKTHEVRRTADRDECDARPFADVYLSWALERSRSDRCYYAVAIEVCRLNDESRRSQISSRHRA